MLVCLMVFYATYNNISVISWCSVLLVEETRGAGENHRHVASHRQTLNCGHFRKDDKGKDVTLYVLRCSTFYHVMGQITKLHFTTPWEQSYNCILPRHWSNHTAGLYQVIGAITQLDFIKSWEQSHSCILQRHGSNHTAGLYHVMGAITQLDFTTSWEQSHSWILPRHWSNHTAGFYHVMGTIKQLDFTVMRAITQLDFTT